jgi:hypothetical protein
VLTEGYHGRGRRTCNADSNGVAPLCDVSTGSQTLCCVVVSNVVHDLVLHWMRSGELNALPSGGFVHRTFQVHALASSAARDHDTRLEADSVRDAVLEVEEAVRVIHGLHTERGLTVHAARMRMSPARLKSGENTVER